MLVSAVEFIDVLLQKRRSVMASIALVMGFVLISVLSPILQAHRASIAAYTQTISSNQATQNMNNSPDAVTNALFQMANDGVGDIRTMEAKTLSSTMSVAVGVTHLDEGIVHGTYATARFTFQAISLCVRTTFHAIGAGILFETHIDKSILKFSSGIVHVSALIRPPDHTPTPLIAQMRAEQASIIQSGTKNVALPAISAGTGGACDNGAGNGGYPLSWCNAPMDSIATIPYTSEPINRECTSYAYWYFTAVEGQTTFKAWGNAKYWASTSNYPAYKTPVVGSIAVETVGTYGHVAIVQALPGQTYGGQVVPAGYVLVSEMNYDWQGHFRYSYSPLTKFSAYIYPED